MGKIKTKNIMTKEEKIKSAWNDLLNGIAEYSYVEGYLSINGWLPMNLLSQNIRLRLAGTLESKFVLNGDFIRPISLTGIEANNGWIRIESQNDLPKEVLDCFFISNGCTYLGYFSNRNNGIFCVDSEDINKNEVSHYQPILKPQPPIY